MDMQYDTESDIHGGERTFKCIFVLNIQCFTIDTFGWALHSKFVLVSINVRYKIVFNASFDVQVFVYL